MNVDTQRAISLIKHHVVKYATGQLRSYVSMPGVGAPTSVFGKFYGTEGQRFAEELANFVLANLGLGAPRQGGSTHDVARAHAPDPAALEMTESGPVPSGMHAGVPWADVPDDYLEQTIKRGQRSPDLCEGAIAEQKRRKANA